ncbi:hypothetical protein I79_012316 [Cricetulus griseus]|uniref:Uncharacterized protein n=1 Tax=Cricetulus griseus TaxID=10029 RepID=G3HNH8_CRIGR|nr:hypothetical protein I79_012316 [Cricetulus griseus]
MAQVPYRHSSQESLLSFTCNRAARPQQVKALATQARQPKFNDCNLSYGRRD